MTTDTYLSALDTYNAANAKLADVYEALVIARTNANEALTALQRIVQLNAKSKPILKPYPLNA